MPEPVLAVRDLHVAYGPIKAVRGCSFEIGAGEAVAIVGANGAGKTTIMRAISNLIPRQGGEVRFQGRSTARLQAHELSQAGLLHVPEGRGIIGRMTVEENLRLAYDARSSGTEFKAALGPVFRRFPRLAERAGQRAGLMSGGEQQMLALAKAMVNPPRLLVVDEPSLGLAPMMIREAFAALAEFREAGMSVLLVEQNVRGALALAERAYVLRQGEIVTSGRSEDLLADAAALKGHLVTQLRRERRAAPGA